MILPNSNRIVYNPSVPPVGDQSPISELPEELVLEILSHLNWQDDINRCEKVCRRWEQLANDPILVRNMQQKEHIYRNIAFGCDKWAKYFGENAISDEDRKIERETLPNNIYDILNSQCLAFPEKKKKVMETHMLVFIPKSINGEPLTLKSLGELAKQYFPDNTDGYRFFWSAVANAIGNKTIDKSGWRLMTTDVLEGSRNKRFDNPTNDPEVQTQRQCVAELAKKAAVEYEVPPALDAAACILAQYFDSCNGKLAWGRRLFSDNPLTYTRCQEKVGDYQVVVGGFAPSGLFVIFSRYDDDDIGVAALRKF